MKYGSYYKQKNVPLSCMYMYVVAGCLVNSCECEVKCDFDLTICQTKFISYRGHCCTYHLQELNSPDLNPHHVFQLFVCVCVCVCVCVRYKHSYFFVQYLQVSPMMTRPLVRSWIQIQVS